MKKIIAKILILIIMFNFIFGNFIIKSLAEDTPTYMLDQSQVNDMILNGKTKDVSGNLTNIKIGKAITGTIVGILTEWIDIIPMVLHIAATISAVTSGIMMNTGSYSSSFNAGAILITVEKIIFGRYFIFNSDYTITQEKFTEMDDNNEIIVLDASFSNGIVSLRENVYLWYYVIRLIAFVLSLATLIYVGIRMATSTIASEQTKYKKMMISWVESLIILLVLPYIIMAIQKANTALVELAIRLKDQMLANGDKTFETEILDSVYNIIKTQGGATVATYSIIYWFLVFMQLKFFLLYTRRVFTIGFLIVISPLITITFPIDKAGDGKAQAFSAWLIELIAVTFVQTIHVYSYIIFMFFAGDIAKASPFIAIIFLYALPRIEKIIKVIFNLRGAVAIKDIKDMLKRKG